MDKSIFLAQIIGLFYLIIAFGFLFNKKYYINMIGKLMKAPGFMFLGGMLSFVAGFAIIFYHNIWQDWHIIITIFGWAGVLKGVMFFVFPKLTESITSWMMSNRGFVAFWIPLPFIVGLMYSYFGFIY